MKTIRTFIAIELPPATQSNLNRVIQQLKTRISSGVRWVPVTNIHITLKFLGDISDKQANALKQALPDIAAMVQPFPILVTGIGAFPNPNRPRVVWAGLQAPDGLTRLQKQIEKLADTIGIPAENRPFSPHLTLGRIHSTATRQELEMVTTTLLSTKINEIGEFDADQVILFRSDLRPTGAIYTALLHAPFQPPTS